jgi:hypothetical protein
VRGRSLDLVTIRARSHAEDDGHLPRASGRRTLGCSRNSTQGLSCNDEVTFTAVFCPNLSAAR